MIEIRDLTYCYPDGSVPVLNHIGVRVEAGEFVLVTGPSGSGKSTLLRCLNGLVPHFSGGTISGSVRVAGFDVVAAGPAHLSRSVGFVSQNPETQSVLDRVEAEIAFGMENAAVAQPEMVRRVDRVLALLDLSALRRRQVSTLSGGERQRLAIAAALVLEPLLLVLDEPTSQLDPLAAESVLEALVRLHRELDLTVVLAEHRLERVLPYADRVLHLEDGRLVVDAPVAEAVHWMPHAPPLIQLGRELRWQPLPLSLAAARPLAQALTNGAAPEMTGSGPRRSARSNHLLLEATDLSYRHSRQFALEEVSLQLRPGEAVALIGRNGSGKSTLLRCLTGLLKPDRGQIFVDGRPHEGRSVAEICRELAYLPQYSDDLLYADTVAGELETTLHNHQIKVTDGTIPTFLAQLALADLAEFYPRDLSVGQRQRVALGAITITGPKVLLLDEPTRGLDYDVKQMLVALWHRWLDQGMALLLVTHDVELVTLIADRVIVLAGGRIKAQGATADVLGDDTEFAPQMARLFPGQRWLTVANVLEVCRKVRAVDGN